MSRCLCIPEVAKDSIKFMIQPNKVRNVRKTEEDEELEPENLYKQRLRQKSSIKKWNDDQPTEVDLIKQYFTITEQYQRSPTKKLNTLPPAD
jgi:hypothetical protein